MPLRVPPLAAQAAVAGEGKPLLDDLPWADRLVLECSHRRRENQERRRLQREARRKRGSSPLPRPGER